jgi:uncharacterized membrane protein YoaK (UPF0700 family)
MPEDKNQTPNPPEPGSLAEKVSKIDEKQWLNYQTIAGAVLGAATGALLFLVKDDGSMLPLNFIIALVVAKFLPDYAEKQMQRSLSRARIALVIMLVAAILGYVGYTLATKGLTAFTTKS